MRTADNRPSVTFCLKGQLASPGFESWLTRHARKLEVGFVVLERRPHLISVRATGAMEMVEAFALAASLGPTDVHVETIDVIDSSYDRIDLFSAPAEA